MLSARERSHEAADHGRKRMNDWMKGVALAAVLAMPAPLAAQDANPNATLIFHDSSGNATLDPAEPQNGSSYSHESLLAIYDTLIRFDQAGNLTPGLAES